jgi:flavin reductase (DIM6/NTAB) family NADH-FMN oxidoreductase RutF
MTTDQQFKEAMRRFPASVTVIAAGITGERCGLTATAVCSLSMDPPQLLVRLNNNSGTCKTVHENGYFSVNVLSHDQVEIASNFGGFTNSTYGDDKFSNDQWGTGITAAPILHDSVISLECELIDSHQAGTHHIVIGEVVNVSIDEQQTALMYRNGNFGIWASKMVLTDCR